MIKKLTITSLIITIILGVASLIMVPFAVRNQLNDWDDRYGKYYNYESTKDISTEGIKTLNITSHQDYRLYGDVYLTNDKDIKIIYEGFSITSPQITEKKDGEVLNLQIELAPINEEQKNIFTALMANSGGIRFRIYVPQDLDVNLYADNFGYVNSQKNYTIEVPVTAQPTSIDDYYNVLKASYNIVDGEAIQLTTHFEKLSYMMTGIFSDYSYGNIERPVLLSIKEKIATDMIAAFSSFAEKNADICSSPEAKSSIIICASTYINAQTKLALLAADEGFWDNGIFENYDQNNYSENAKTAILQLNQAKIDFLQSMTTTVVSRKNEVIDMITFI